MTIIFDCDCGMTLRVKDEKAGRTIHCPECDDKLVVPDDSGSRIIEEDKTPRKSKRVPTARIVDDEDDEPPRRRRRDEDDEDEPRPKKRKKKRPRVEESSGGSAAPIAIGCLMMLGAVVWFVVGLMADRILIYPPIMFVLGIISVAKGLMPK